MSLSNTQRHPGFDCFVIDGTTPLYENEFGYLPKEYFLGQFEGKDLWIYQEHQISIGVVCSETPGDYFTIPVAILISRLLNEDTNESIDDHLRPAMAAVRRARRMFDIEIKSFTLSGKPEDL